MRVLCATLTVAVVAEAGPPPAPPAPAPLPDTFTIPLPAKVRVSASVVAGDTISRFELRPAPAGVEAALAATPQSPVALVRVERLSREALRVELAPRAGRLVCRAEAARIDCGRPSEQENLSRFGELLRDPVDPGSGDGAEAIRVAERSLHADDREAAAESYLAMRKRYATRALADVRLADIAWLSGERERAAAAWRLSTFQLRRRAEGPLAAVRVAAADFYGSGTPLAKLPAELPLDQPLGANLALAIARLLGDAGRFEEALDRLTRSAPTALKPAFDRLRRDLVAAAIRLASLRGESLRAAALLVGQFDAVRAHPERADLQLAAADALLDLDLGFEAIEVVNDLVSAGATIEDEPRIDAWISRVQGAVERGQAPATAQATVRAAHPLVARLDSLRGEVAALERLARATPKAIP